MPASAARLPRPRSGTGAGGAPFEPPVAARESVLRSSQSAASASTARDAVSTMASRSSPLRRVATICVVITRKPPPKMYGALNEASEVMKVSSAAPTRLGRSSGRTTRVKVRILPAPRLAAAS